MKSDEINPKNVQPDEAGKGSQDLFSAYGLDQGLEKILGDVGVSPAAADEGQGGSSGLVGRILSRVFRPALFPFARRLTQTNYNTKRALFAMASVIRDQQHQLDELYEEVRRLNSAAGNQTEPVCPGNLEERND